MNNHHNLVWSGLVRCCWLGYVSVRFGSCLYVRFGEAWSGKFRSGQVGSGQVSSGMVWYSYLSVAVWSCKVRLGQVGWSPVRYVRVGQGISYFIIHGQVGWGLVR